MRTAAITAPAASAAPSVAAYLGCGRGAVRVYERYSMAGGNRVSLNLTLVGSGRELFLSAITSGGSQAMFFKINTWGEEAFLDRVRELIESL